jgi:hypothetical protein
MRWVCPAIFVVLPMFIEMLQIIQYMDDIPITLDEALMIEGQYSRAEVYMINQRKDLLQKTIRKMDH